MRIARNLRKDQETILKFLDVFGGGSVALGSSNKNASPGFFISAHAFIQDYIEGSFFRKEELLMQALERCGFPADGGPVGAMKNGQKVSREAAEHRFKAAQDWQAGVKQGRAEVGWAASELSSTMRQQLDRLKNLVFPLLEQNISPEEEAKVAESLNHVGLEAASRSEQEKYAKMIETLEEELSDWK